MAAKQHRAEVTRERLVAAFRDSFLEIGFEATTTDAILEQTGLSKGALYHHFKSKTDIAEEIYRATSRRAIEQAIASADPVLPPLVRLREASIAWLRIIGDKQVATILFDIGPTALGPLVAKRIEDELSLAGFEALIREANAQDEAGISDPAMAARLVNALVAEAALMGPSRRRAAAAAIGPVIDAVLAAMAQ